MKLSELEERARQERDEAAALDAEQKLEEQIAEAEAAEEFRQKVIAWIVEEGDLDANELGATLSVVDVVDQYKRLKLSLPEHTAVIFQAKMEGDEVVGIRDDRFAVKNAMGGTHYWNNLGYALLAASEQWGEREEQQARDAEREAERKLREELAAERGSKYLNLLDDHPILRPILDLLGAVMEDREQFAEDLEYAEELHAGAEARYQEELGIVNSAVQRAERERDDLQRDLYDAKDELDAEKRKHKRGW